MLDFSHLPNVNNGAIIQIFRARSDWQTWVKPRGKSFASIFAIGPGSGGGGGFSRTVGSAGGGGSGGGGGGIATMAQPISALPDILYILAQFGAVGGPAGLAGGTGLQTIVGLYPQNVSATNLVVSQSTDATPGNPGAATSGGAAVSGGLAATRLLYSGPCLAFAGNNGGGSGAGGAQTGAVGTGITVSQWTSGGTGGGGATTTDFAGGAFTGDGFLIANLAGGAAAGARGSDGYEMTASGLLIPMGTPGTGGGSNNSGTGGAGGNGALGCGGGGGGTGVTGGAGGNGGNGFVIVTSW